jgi:ferredoxin-thioredoxin reductase catalytic subunit
MKELDLPENVRLNDDADFVKNMLIALEKRNGYCPCRLQRTEENKCICQEFKDQIADPDFEGYCHCMLYYKSRD